MLTALLVAASVLLILVCGVFVAAEFSLVTVSRPAVERAAEAGMKGARSLEAALPNLSTHLSSAQIGITVTNLAVGWLAEPAVAGLLHAPLAAVGVGDGGVRGISLTLALVIVTLATMVFGELVPKNLAIAHPMGVARTVQLPLRAFTTATKPLTVALNSSANRVVRALGIEPQEELASARTPEELVSVVRSSAESGSLAESTADLVERMLRFDDKRARDVLTPRTRLVWLADHDSAQRVVDLAREHGLSRFPVARGDDLDDIVGVVQLSQAIAVPAAERATTTVGTFAGEPLVVPDTAPLDEVLWALRDYRTELCVVLDEYGGTAGITTFEDVVEEIVGEVSDEHDEPAPTHERTEDGWVISGLLRPDEVRELTRVRLPADDHRYETVAGLVLHRLGRVPEAGDSAVVDGVRITVARMDNHRIDQVHVEPTPDGEQPDGQSGERADGPAGGTQEAGVGAGNGHAAGNRHAAGNGRAVRNGHGGAGHE
ncbi:Hemolysin, contains CBS domains [Actinopolymorpha cephalotaxi]|uniref:CBS domain containing-hemolysin-like protein n=1 Tax=Actinopolymorpha cephalotaxi TaxID=504797 RepID=A0A1I2NMU7_9ACTN|nr:hemolysin family protein [Actinopolymorpha cephalotaxi]NYH85531.1 CBS domain containing-hemolysin-like protein [Actinopolymorpha cephalotaxi]SFG02786.1 Hemolysin, contains CBS domains [Actinopolymorpha cephalotaxi]